MAKSKPTQKTTKNKAKPAKPVKLVKKADKKETKKPLVKAKAKPVKAAAHVAAKKTELKKEKEVVKTNAKAVKNNAKANADESGVALQKTPKTEAKSKTKAKKAEKKSEADLDSDLIGDDEFGDSEIAEYEEDLKAVEDDEDDSSLELSDEDEDIDKKDEEIYLTDSEGRRLCKVRDCDQVASVEAYCRYHYLLLWKKIQVRKQILNDGKLEKYLEDLTSRYPDKFLEVIKKDLKTEKDFMSVIHEMELDESALNEAEGESDDDVQSFADEIRGIGEAPSMDDDGDY